MPSLRGRRTIVQGHVRIPGPVLEEDGLPVVLGIDEFAEHVLLTMINIVAEARSCSRVLNAYDAVQLVEHVKSRHKLARHIPQWYSWEIQLICIALRYM